MTPYYEDDLVTIWHGDCLDVLRTLPDASVDAVVTDPPYGLEFMGKDWDSFRGDVGRGVKVAEERAAEMTPAGQGHATSAGPYLAARVDSIRSAGKPFQDWCEQWARECLRVLKPGGHMLAFGGSRTWHRLAAAVEDAGFEIRDSIAWLYGSGFPKSLDVSKAIDKRGGNPGMAEEIGQAIRAARESRGWAKGRADKHFCAGSTNWFWFEGRDGIYRPPTPETFARIVAEWPELGELAIAVGEAQREVIGERTTGRGSGRGGVPVIGDSGNYDLTAAATDAAKAWEGWGTALKPAFEPIVVGRKPLVGTVAANVLAHGTGALNIDATRTGTDGGHRDTGEYSRSPQSVSAFGDGLNGRSSVSVPGLGRWPTNVVLDESQAAVLDEQTGVSRSRVGKPRGATSGDGWGMTQTGAEYDDEGGPSRFFPTFRYEAKAPSSERPNVDGVQHPTVKPLALMRWLVRLVTPPNGVVLEPFAGSGTTVEACLLEEFRCVAIEREADYLPLIEKRISKPLQQSLLGDWGGAA